MREIKFRAWQPFASLHRQPGMYLVDDIVWYQVTDEQPNAGEVFLTRKVGTSRSSEFFEDVEIMQYTGLKDKNGVEIYEGDILAIGDVQATVCWNDGGAYFDLASPDDDDMSPDYLLGHAIYDRPAPQVIGNIYENPELLEATS